MGRYARAEMVENQARLLQRNAVYKRFGYDVQSSIHFILSRLHPVEGRILEIGTGKGRFLTALARHADDITSIDVDAAEQRAAKLSVAQEGLTPRVRFLRGDAMSMKWKRPAFDLTVSMNALHHIPDQALAVKEMLRVTRPTGRIMISDFDEEGFEIIERIHESEGRVHTRLPYRWDNLADIFREHGWSSSERAGHHQTLIMAHGPDARR
ncbi:MAG: methyltransferase domain-containing protein [Verrucomicrobia bacterium]|nr:methyltransferase domain-containing protein [Verrucomicrobiota bacterium]